MGLFDNFKKQRKFSQKPNAPVSADIFLHIIEWGDFLSSAGVTISFDNALIVPAIWAAGTFFSDTLASLPLEVFCSSDTGRECIQHSIRAWLNGAVNPILGSFA